jgi:adenylate kinase family enzyme
MPSPFASQKNKEARRRVMPGYPKDFVFKNYDEYKKYFVGDSIICLLCGKHYRSLGVHLNISHETSINDYKKKYGILWGKSLICNETREIHSDNAKERIAKGELIPPTIEGRRKQGMFARKYIKKGRRNLPLHKVYVKENIKEYNLLRGYTGEVTKKREANRSKRGTPEFKKKMADRPQSKAFIAKYKNYWKGRKQSEEHIRKRSEAVKAYHIKLKEKNERTAQLVS